MASRRVADNTRKMQLKDSTETMRVIILLVADNLVPLVDLSLNERTRASR